MNHIDAIVGSAKGALGFIMRTLKHKFSIDAAKLLYVTLVRSKLEYACVIWNPFHDVHCDKIESVQKQFLIYALRSIFQRDENYVLPPYEFRCNVLNLHPLWRRRAQYSIFLIYDLLLGISKSSTLRERINYTRLQYDVNQRSMRNVELIRVNGARTDYSYYQPFNVACRNFNLVRAQFMESESRNAFRKNVFALENVKLKSKL